MSLGYFKLEWMNDNWVEVKEHLGVLIRVGDNKGQRVLTGVPQSMLANALQEIFIQQYHAHSFSCERPMMS